jgi:hypothetical protein
MITEAKYTISELTRQKESYEREYKLMKNLNEELKRDYPEQLEKIKAEIAAVTASYEGFYHPMVVEDILSRLHEVQHKVRATEARLIEEIQKNTNEMYKMSKKNGLIKKLQKLAHSLIEERKIWQKEREEVIFESIKIRDRERLLKQQIEGYLMEIKDLKHRINYLERNNVGSGLLLSYEIVSEKASVDENLPNRKHANSAEDIVPQRPKSSNASHSQTPSMQQLKDEIENLPQRPSTADIRMGRRQSSNFKIRRTSLLNRSLIEESPEDINLSFYSKIEELFVSSY